MARHGGALRWSTILEHHGGAGPGHTGLLELLHPPTLLPSTEEAQPEAEVAPQLQDPPLPLPIALLFSPVFLPETLL